jgi:signal transduction histidine kinase
VASTTSGGAPPQARKSGSGVGKFLNLALGPSDAIRDTGNRRRARWLAALLLLMTFSFGTLDSFYVMTKPGYVPPWHGYTLLLGAYALVRRGRYTTGALLALATVPAVSFGLVASGQSASPRTTLSFLVLGIMLSSVLLPVRAVALLTLVELAGLVALRLFLPSLPGGGDATLGPAVLVAIAGGIACVGALLHQRVEQDRRDVLEQANAELERRVEERTAELRRANAELEAFAYSASHDLRTPLRAIDGRAAMLAHDEGARLSDAARLSLQRIRATTAGMTALVDRMLDLSRISRSELKDEEIDLVVIARGIAEELRGADPGREVELVLPPSIRTRGDTTLVRMALGNLLENAWKFTQGVQGARVELARAAGPDGEPAYVVRDNGVGFAADLADKLFQPFQRLHRTDEFAGNGIGTAIVARAVERHGGRVWAEGEVGRGAAFYFTLGASGG